MGLYTTGAVVERRKEENCGQGYVRVRERVIELVLATEVDVGCTVHTQSRFLLLVFPSILTLSLISGGLLCSEGVGIVGDCLWV